MSWMERNTIQSNLVELNAGGREIEEDGIGGCEANSSDSFNDSKSNGGLTTEETLDTCEPLLNVSHRWVGS